MFHWYSIFWNIQEKINYFVPKIFLWFTKSKSRLIFHEIKSIIAFGSLPTSNFLLNIIGKRKSIHLNKKPKSYYKGYSLLYCIWILIWILLWIFQVIILHAIFMKLYKIPWMSTFVEYLIFIPLFCYRKHYFAEISVKSSLNNCFA